MYVSMVSVQVPPFLQGLGMHLLSSNERTERNNDQYTLRKMTDQGSIPRRNFKDRFFKRSLTCTIGSANDLIDGGQPRAKNGF